MIFRSYNISILVRHSKGPGPDLATGGPTHFFRGAPTSPPPRDVLIELTTGGGYKLKILGGPSYVGLGAPPTHIHVPQVPKVMVFYLTLNLLNLFLLHYIILHTFFDTNLGGPPWAGGALHIAYLQSALHIMLSLLQFMVI